jgi:hypothetical protein
MRRHNSILLLCLGGALAACGALPNADLEDGDVQVDLDDASRADRADITVRSLSGVSVPSALSRSETRRLYKTAAAFRADFGATPRGVDFSRDWVVFYSAGARPTGGFVARVQRVRTTDSGATLKVTTSLESPAADCLVTQAPTRPHALVAFRPPSPRPRYTRFYRADTTRECGRACVSPQPTDLSSLDLSLRAHVRAVYFTPSDRPFRACAGEHLDQYIRIARTFFRDEMRAEGRTKADGSGKTFRYESGADGRWRVVFLRGEHDAAHYQSQPDPAGAALAEMIARLPQAFHNNNVTVYVYDLAVVEDRRVHYSGNGGSGAPWEGEGAGYVLQGAHFLGMGFDTLATRIEDQAARFEQSELSGIEDWSADGTWRELTRGEYASNMVGAAVHELGHAFYLEHVFTDYDGDGIEVNLMGNGFRRFGGRFSLRGPQPFTRLGRESATSLDAAHLFNTK